MSATPRHATHTEPPGRAHFPGCEGFYCPRCSYPTCTCRSHGCDTVPAAFAAAVGAISGGLAVAVVGLTALFWGWL